MTKTKHIHTGPAPHRQQLPAVTIDAVLRPQTLGEYLAYGISQLGSPPMMSLFALIAAVVSLTWAAVWMWSGIYVLAMLVPLAFLIWQLHNGHITDIDIHLREQRQSSQLVTIASCAIAWLAMWLGDAPPILTLMTGVAFVQWLVLYVITLRWKISIHTTSAAGATLIILRAVGIAAAPLVITIPLIVWSRVKLRRHTLAQAIAGVLLGSGVVIGALLLTPAL